MAFWGLVLEPKKQYSQSVEQPFHISMAVLDLGSSDAGEESSAVVLRRDGGDFILCNLSRKHKILNVPLNLDFEIGDEINFYVQGNSNVHLTGYVGDDSMEGFDSDMSGEEEEDEEEETGRSPLLKATKKLLDKADKRKADSEKANAAKKSKLADLEEEDSEDSDFDLDDSEIGEEEEEDDDEEADSDTDDPDEVLKQLAEAKKQMNQGKKDKPKQGGKPEVQQGGKNQPQIQGKPNKEKQNKKKQQQQQQQQQSQKSPNANQQGKGPNGNQKTNGALKKYNEGGVFIEELCIGTGPAAKPGRMVTVYYVGKIKNKQFDASQSGPGFQFRLGRGEVIKGWDIGVKGMQVGGKRRLSIPPKLAYGSQGSPPVIPPNSPLVFEVELKGVR